MEIREALRALTLRPGCRADDVRRAHRRTVRHHHPDVAEGAGTDASEFLRVQAAFETLTSPPTRDRLEALAELQDEGRCLRLPQLVLDEGITWRADVEVASLRFPVGLVYDLDLGALESCLLAEPERTCGSVALGEGPHALAPGQAAVIALRADTLAGALAEISSWCARRAWHHGAVPLHRPGPGVDLLSWSRRAVVELAAVMGLGDDPAVRARLDEGLGFLAEHLATHGASAAAVRRFVVLMLDDALRAAGSTT